MKTNSALVGSSKQMLPRPSILRRLAPGVPLLVLLGGLEACGDDPSAPWVHPQQSTETGGSAGAGKAGTSQAGGSPCCGSAGASKGGASGSGASAGHGGFSGMPGNGGAGGTTGSGGSAATGGVPATGGTAGSGASGGAGSPSSCLWGDQLSASPGVGLATEPHGAGPNSDQQKVLNRMNSFRGGTPLKWNGCLGDIAQSHCDDMLQRGYYGHGTLGNTSAWMIPDRVSTSGLVITGSPDEDVLTGDLKYWLDSDIANTVDMWMNDDHKLPILNCDEVGIGISVEPMLDSFQVWVTADFSCSK